MKRLIKSSETFDDGYMQPYTAFELLRLLDKAIQYSKKSISSSHRSSVPSEISDKPVYSFFVTSDFEKGVKKLKKDHKTKELETLKSIITELSESGGVSGKYGDHRVGGRYRELKLSSNRNVLLVYSYVPGSTYIAISIEFSDITNHKNLNKSLRSDHSRTAEYINDDEFKPEDMLAD